MARSIRKSKGLVSPGHSPGELQVVGDLTFIPTSVLEMEISGLIPGDEFDRISVQSVGDEFGTVDLGNASLNLWVLDGFESSPEIFTGSFDLIWAEGGLSGVFGNVDNGGRLVTADGLGSFLVTIGPDRVTLSNFVTAVPEPNCGWLLVMVVGGWTCGKYRKR